MKTKVFFSGALSWIAEGWLESYVFYLAWPEWKGLKFYSPLWFNPFGWKHRGIAGGSQGEYHKITDNVWVEPWVGLQGANKSAHWELKNPRAVLYLGLLMVSVKFSFKFAKRQKYTNTIWKGARYFVIPCRWIFPIFSKRIPKNVFLASLNLISQILS